MVGRALAFNSLGESSVAFYFILFDEILNLIIIITSVKLLNAIEKKLSLNSFRFRYQLLA